MVNHRQLLNFATTPVYACLYAHACQRLHRSSFSTMSFDISVEEIFATLCAAARLVLRTEQWLNDADTFWQLCAEHDVRVLSFQSRLLALPSLTTAA